MEVNEKRKKWGGTTDVCENCDTKKERKVETLGHLLIECPAYKKERKAFELEMNKRIGGREWETIKQSEDKGRKQILGLRDYGRKVTDATKEYLKNIWKNRQGGNKEQKQNKTNRNRFVNMEDIRNGENNIISSKSQHMEKQKEHNYCKLE